MDIVYILRNGIQGEELRYSLRSLENLPHDRVWFFGGEPEGLVPDEQVTLLQKGISNWEKVCWTLTQICNNEAVSENFYLFNDDFFVMKPVKEIPPYYDGTLLKRIDQLKMRTGGFSLYMNELEKVRELLLEEGKKTYNYAVHVPMVINKDKAIEVLRKYPRIAMFRSLYGNYWNIGGRQMKDCKITDSTKPSKDAKFLSTTEHSFESNVGDYIRGVFGEKCKYEV